MGDTQGLIYESKFILFVCVPWIRESVKNSIYDNYEHTCIFSTISRITACNFALIFRCVYVKTSYDDQYNLLSPALDGELLQILRDGMCDSLQR